jgi:pathogenesis-related protein 1
VPRPHDLLAATVGRTSVRADLQVRTIQRIIRSEHCCGDARCGLPAAAIDVWWRGRHRFGEVTASWQYFCYGGPVRRVYRNMRSACWLLMVLVGNGVAQAPARGLAEETLAAHNAIRAQVRVAPLVWSARLERVAQEWANHLLATKSFVHRPNSPHGENLYRIEGGRASPAQVVQSWASEARGYDYRSNRCRGACGHYTQIVWRGTREVGCAVAKGRLREVWVCEYDPPGNWVGERPY